MRKYVINWGRDYSDVFKSVILDSFMIPIKDKRKICQLNRLLRDVPKGEYSGSRKEYSCSRGEKSNESFAERYETTANGKMRVVRQPEKS